MRVVREGHLIQLARLLATADPPDLVGRGAHVTYAGDPKRRQTVLLPLLIRWVQWRCLAVDPEPFVGRATRAGTPKRRVFSFSERPESAA